MGPARREVSSGRAPLNTTGDVPPPAKGSGQSWTESHICTGQSAFCGGHGAETCHGRLAVAGGWRRHPQLATHLGQRQSLDLSASVGQVPGCTPLHNENIHRFPRAKDQHQVMCGLRPTCWCLERAASLVAGAECQSRVRPSPTKLKAPTRSPREPHNSPAGTGCPKAHRSRQKCLQSRKQKSPPPKRTRCHQLPGLTTTGKT